MTKTIGSKKLTVVAGTRVWLEGHAGAKTLEAADWLEGVPGYEGCLAFPTALGKVAVRVKITARTLTWGPVRIRVEFLHDDKPSTFVKGEAWVETLKVEYLS